MFFKKGEIVVIDGGVKRWCVDHIAEDYRRGELVQVADLSDLVGGKRAGVLTERLTKVAG